MLVVTALLTVDAALRINFLSTTSTVSLSVILDLKEAYGDYRENRKNLNVGCYLNLTLSFLVTITISTISVSRGLPQRDVAWR